MYLINLPNEVPNNYFRYQRFALKWTGISFEGNESWLYRVFSVVFISNLTVMYVGFEPYEAFLHRRNFDVLINILMYMGTDLLGIAKAFVLLYYRIRVGIALDKLEKGVFTPNVKRGGAAEETWIKQCILNSNQQTFLYYITVLLTLGIGIFGTFYKRLRSSDYHDWENPFGPFDIVDGTKSPNFELGWIYQGACRCVLAILVVSADTLIAGVMSVLSVQFKMLQNSVRRVVQNAYEDMMNDESLVVEYPTPEKSCELPLDVSQMPKPFLQDRLKMIIEYHLAIITLAEEIEELFNILVLTVFLATMFILCFIMYHASLFPLLSMRAVQDFCYVSVVMVQVFLYCYWGNEIALESVAVANSCYEANFVGADLWFQKGLALMIQRSMRPVIMTAGKFTDLSLRTYAWIIRASFSYFMVLRKHNGLD